ncbi:adenylosuccinate lyase [Deinococcota bacterium DY0809b]
MIARYQTPEMAALWSPEHRFRVWAEVERLALEAWEGLGAVPAGVAEKLARVLPASDFEPEFSERVAAIETETHHDVVAFVRALAERSGDGAVRRYLHYGLTSSDVVDTAQNRLLAEALDLVLAELENLLAALAHLAVRYKRTPAVGRTHGVHAEPTAFGLRFLSFYAAALRDRERLRRAREAVATAVVSGSVGNYAHTPPEVEAYVAERLGLVPEPVSTQVVPRDRHAEVLAALAVFGANLERVAVELRHLARTEVLEVTEPFREGQTGSSSMPHKKNPVALENISGLARLLKSNLQAALENVALWHERDISHSSVERVILPDTTTLAHYLARRLTRVLEGLVVHEDRIRRNLELTRGLVYSQRVLNLLIEKGLERDRAYRLVQRNAMKCWEEGRDLAELLAADPENPLAAEELAAAFDPAHYLRHVGAIYARFGL